MGSAVLFRAGIVMAWLLPGLLQAAISTTQAANGTGISVNSNGSYDITFPAQGWRFGGDIGATLSNVAVFKDADALGEFAEISFDYTAGMPRHAAIRAYNLLLATLSAGPIGVGDRLGTVNRDNLLRAARADGAIVKPDVPIVPTDRSFVEESQRLNSPLIASTYTDFDGLRVHYVFGFDRGFGTSASFQPAEIGIDRAIYAYDYFGATGSTVGPYDFYSRPMTGGRVYTVLAPIGPSGIAVLGDLGQFVPLGKKRIAALRDDGVVHLTVLFAAGEASRTISGYAPASPTVAAVAGSIGKVAYDDGTGRFTVEVIVSADMTATVEIQP